MSRPMGTEGPLLVPGSEAWLRTISASKIAAIAGVSPWDSPFSLYWKMNGTIVEPQTDQMRRGHYLEPAIAQWFADQHPEFDLELTGTWTHALYPWATASPDRHVLTPIIGGHNALLEIKSTTQDHEWVDGPPPYVAAQCQWQMEVTGLDVCHVAVLGSFLEFSEHVIEYDRVEAGRLVEMAADFLGKLERQEHPPIDDGSEATWETVRRLHPDIHDDEECELGEDLAREYCTARRNLAEAEADEREAKSRVVEAMGDAKRAMYCGQKVAYRESRNGGVPYLKAAKPLPSFETNQETAA